jgi:hypothetical protein
VAKTAVKPKSKPLTHKEMKLVQGVAMGKSQTEAALEAYDTTNADSAKAIGSRALSKVNVREALDEALARHGITTDAITKPVADALQAVKLVEIEGKLKTMPDHSVRLKAASIGAKFMGVDSGDDGGKTNINFNFGTQNYVKGRD